MVATLDLTALTGAAVFAALAGAALAGAALAGAALAGATLVDTTETTALFETALAPRLYVRPDAVAMDRLRPSPTTTHCPYKGTASYWTAVVGEVVVEDVAWTYADPVPEALPIRGMLSFYADRAEVLADLPTP